MGITNISARWTGEELNYVGTDTKGNEIQMGGEGVSPAQMVLLGLGGCMGMDVVSILKKKRQNVTSVEVQVTGYNAEEYPKPYHTVEMKFIIKGENVSPKAVARSIELSVETYCVVGQTLQNKVKIKPAFEIME